MTEKVPPAVLQARGRKFWRETVENYDLSPAELAVLIETCRTIDNLDVLAVSITTDGAMVTGAKGQPVVNPALTEARGQRAILHRLVSALNLPDAEGDSVPSMQSVRARKAATARWRGHRKDAGRRRPVDGTIA